MDDNYIWQEQQGILLQNSRCYHAILFGMPELESHHLERFENLYLAITSIKVRVSLHAVLCHLFSIPPPTTRCMWCSRYGMAVNNYCLQYIGLHSCTYRCRLCDIGCYPMGKRNSSIYDLNLEIWWVLGLKKINWKFRSCCECHDTNGREWHSPTGDNAVMLLFVFGSNPQPNKYDNDK